MPRVLCQVLTLQSFTQQTMHQGLGTEDKTKNKSAFKERAGMSCSPTTSDGLCTRVKLTTAFQNVMISPSLMEVKKYCTRTGHTDWLVSPLPSPTKEAEKQRKQARHFTYYLT